MGEYKRLAQEGLPWGVRVLRVEIRGWDDICSDGLGVGETVRLDPGGGHKWLMKRAGHCEGSQLRW